MIKYKAEWYGRTFIQIDPFYPSTRTCHNCGHIHKYLPPNIREWTCPPMWKTPSKRHQCSHKHKKRRITNNIRTKNTNKNIKKNYEPISQWEIAW